MPPPASGPASFASPSSSPPRAPSLAAPSTADASSITPSAAAVTASSILPHPSLPSVTAAAAESRRRRRRRPVHGRHPADHAEPWAPFTTSRSGRPGLLATSPPSAPDASAWPSHYRSFYYRPHQPQQPQLDITPEALRPSHARRSAKRLLKLNDVAACAMDEVAVKKPRTGASPPGLVDILPPLATNPLPSSAANVASASDRSHRDGSLSPLFFSHVPSRYASRHPSATASEIAASMLSRGRDDTSGGVTTVKLPRASVASTSPAMSGSTPGSLSSSADLSAASLSPDARALPSGLQMVQTMGAIELLEHDERPTFLLDLSAAPDPSRPGLNILYYNNALRRSSHVYNLLAIDLDASAVAEGFDRFKAWAYHAPRSDGSSPNASRHRYGGINWTCITLRQRFRFISGNLTSAAHPSAEPSPSDEPVATMNATGSPLGPLALMTPAGEPADPSDYFGDVASSLEGDVSGLGAIVIASKQSTDARHPDEFTNQVLQHQLTKSVFDWTRVPVTDALPDHIKFARSVDWALTPLGPMCEWSPDLRAMSNLIMGSAHPAAMYWGPDLICIYNAAYIELAGHKHPSLMGKRYKDAWSEIWLEIEPIFTSAWECGQATMKHDNHLFINRDGFLEETYFSWAIVPLGADGEVVGLHNPAFENTLRSVNDRRMLTLREIGERTATAMTVSGFWPQVQKGLEYNEYDVPFNLIYSVKEDAESEVYYLQSGSFMHSPQVVLEASSGLPAGHPAAPAYLDLRTSEEGFAPHMRQCMTSESEPLFLCESAGTLPQELLDGIKWRGFEDPCRTMVVFPVVPTTKEAVAGFIVMGLNPRRPYDENYKLFIHLLSRQLATSMASVVLFEEEIRRGQRAARLADLDRQELSMQLLLRTQEASESEYRFTRMVEFAPVGMFIADGQGHITYYNDMWWQISRHSRVDKTELAWMNSVRAEDRASLEEAWQKLLQERVTISVEFRFNHSQQKGDNRMDTWVLMSAFPEKDAEGRLKSIFGCITDISSQKWAEKVQNERREEAVELKRQQENFIDITSHEMRNPLSAVLQCADQITNNIASFGAQGEPKQVQSLLDGCMDAANTISLCASHQKRIVDDILTLSKLDSHLLAVTPVDEQPVKVVQCALKMFESELSAHNIELDFRVDSFERHGIEWAKLDPSRLRQVLINLMTNAIKFTQGRERRSIAVSLRASKDLSEVTSRGVVYLDRNDGQRSTGMNIDNVDEWGAGERINIHCSVEDTGPGLSEEELKVLFQRFQQATPQTHVQYGGSGLGLFISKILTEMQGGQIGVMPTRGSGSKFNFYIQSRKFLDPPAGYERISPLKIWRRTQGPPPVTTPQLRSTPPVRDPSVPPGRSPFDVLIVEDNIVNQKVLQRQLRSCGNNTFVANHGCEALQTLQKSRFWAGQEANGVDISIILMDLEMPVMDGMTCARRIRELERQGTIIKHIPIIAITAYARPEQIENAKAAGIDDVISKPFRIPELMPKIEELVGRYASLSVPTKA